MKKEIKILLEQRQNLQKELVEANKSESRNEEILLKALEDNSKLINLFVNDEQDTLITDRLGRD